MPRNPDKKRCAANACKGWAVRGGLHCRTHRDMAASTVLPGGAPLANQNARVHGLYARYVPLADLQEALNVPLDDLQLEIALVRRSLAELVGAKLSPVEYVPLLRQAVGALSSLMKAQRALSGANDDDDIGAVLGEMGL